MVDVFRGAGGGGGADGGSAPTMLLAPMVRASHLALRMIALHWGAHAVFSEELIAKKLLKVERRDNAVMGTTDFVLASGGNHESLVFRTNAWERDRVVLQIGAADANEAVQAASVFANDVAGVDLNMGCPQHFSLSGGMGAALLKKPELAADIIRRLRTTLPASVTVSAKIRLLNDEASTVALMQQLQAAGAQAITVHARQVSERPRDKARWNELRALVDCVNIPVLANGDVWHLADARRLVALSGASAVMTARGAMADPRLVFTGQPYASLNAWVADYLNVAEVCGSTMAMDKWFIAQICRNRTGERALAERTAQVAQSKTKQDLRDVFGLAPFIVTANGAGDNLYSAEAWQARVASAMSTVADVAGDEDAHEHKRAKREMAL